MINFFKRLPQTFYLSSLELKKLSTITSVGVLIAIYVAIAKVELYPVEWLKISFAYLALMAISMLFGPVVGVIAAIPCDLIGTLVQGKTIMPIFMIPEMLSALIYGIFLYNINSTDEKTISSVFFGKKFFNFELRLGIARLFVILICNIFLNTLLISFQYSIPIDFFTISVRVFKNLIQFFADYYLMALVLIPLRVYYNKYFRRQKVENV